MNCINLCDLIGEDDFQNGYIDKLIKSTNTVHMGRIYFGSYFCSRYFLGIDFVNVLKPFCLSHIYLLTLVIPVSSEADLQSVKDVIRTIIKELPVDEITVNDVGMLSYIQDNYSIKINLGRLFFKDERDVRLSYLFHGISHFKELDIVGKHISHGLFGYVELDPLSANLDFEHNTHIKLALHEPLCYITTGNICKYASINTEVKMKFRPNAICGRECRYIYEKYVSEDPDYTMYRIGRTMYFMNEQLKSSSGCISRYIYFPFREMDEVRREGVSN